MQLDVFGEKFLLADTNVVRSSRKEIITISDYGLLRSSAFLVHVSVLLLLLLNILLLLLYFMSDLNGISSCRRKLLMNVQMTIIFFFLNLPSNPPDEPRYRVWQMPNQQM